MTSDERMRPDGRGACDVRSVLGVLHTFIDDRQLTLDWLEHALRKEGLHVITAEQKAVLDAMAIAQIIPRKGLTPAHFAWEHHELGACEAELARREANHGK